MKTGSNGERLDEFVYNVITLEHLHRYAIAKELVNNKIVLDIACGEGYGSYLLSETAAGVTGMDIDHLTIEKARLKYKRPQLEFLIGNVEAIPCPEAKYDVVVSFETLEHISEHDKMLSECKRVLKPGGILILSTPDKLNYSDKPNYDNPFHLKELYKNEFEILIKSKFRNNRLLFQQSGLLSLVAPQLPAGEPLTYSGDFSHLTSEPGLGALYMITIASDDQLPEIPLSIFRSDTFFPTILKEQQEAVRKTMSYKLGHTLLKPLKIIRTFFWKKSQ